MLQSIRDKATGWIAYVIIGLISVPFMFFGVQSYLSAGGKTIVAKVNGEEIGLEVFQQALQRQQVQIREMFGGSLPEGLVDGEEIKRSVLDRLISSKLMMQYASDNNYNVSDSAVAEMISQISVFQQDGKFSPEKYEMVLKQQRINRSAFEQQIRDEAVLKQFPAAVSLTEGVTSTENNQWFRLKNERRSIDVVKFSQTSYLEGIAVSEDEIKSYYDAHDSSYMAPEQVKVSYLMLDEAELAKSVAVSEEELSKFYEEDIARYQTPESLDLQRIILAFAEDARPESKESLKSEAYSLYERISKGEDFSQLAKTYSADKLTAAKGGELLGVRRGDFAKSFEDVVFSLSEGELSQPFETAAGYEIVKLIGKHMPEPLPFSEIRDRVEADFRQQEAERLFIEKSEQLATLSYEMPGSLDGTADVVGLPLEESEWFSLESSASAGIAEASSVRKAAFSDAVKLENQNSEVIELGAGKQLVLRVLDVKPSEPLELSAVSAQIEEILKTQRAQELMLQDGGKAIEFANRDGKSFADIAAQFGSEVEKIELTRDSQNVPRAVLSSVFRLKSSDDAADRSIAGINTGTGEFWLVDLTAVDSPETSVASDAEDAGFVRTQEVLDAVSKAIESRAEIQIFEVAIE